MGEPSKSLRQRKPKGKTTRSAGQHTPIIFQMETTECGAACLAMVCAHWGKHMPLERMRLLTGVTRNGCSAGDLMRAAKRMGLDCHAYRKSAADLPPLVREGPCILMWNDSHFVVAEHFSGGAVHLLDPALGRRRVRQDELESSYSGIVMTFRPTNRFEREPKSSQVIPRVRALQAQTANERVRLSICNLLLIVPTLALTLAVYQLVETLFKTQESSSFLRPAAIVVAAIVARLLLQLYRTHVQTRMRYRLALVSSNSFVDHLLKLPMGFFAQRQSGDLIARIEANEQAGATLVTELSTLWYDLLRCTILAIALLALSPVLTLLGIGGLTMALFLQRLASHTLDDAVIRRQQDKGMLLGKLCAGLDVLPSLKAAGAESGYAKDLLAWQEGTRTTDRSLNALRSLSDAFSAAGPIVLDVVLLACGSLKVLNNQLSFGSLFAFILLFGSFSAPVRRIVSMAERLQELAADIDRSDDVLGFPADTWFDAPERRETGKGKLIGSMEAENVSFSFGPSSPPVVHGVSLALGPGQSLGIVGRSGSGKSTLARLLCGLYRPQMGEVRYDGRSVATIPRDVLHASVVLVGQNASLLPGTVRQNLTLWNPAIGQDDLDKAARDACIYDDIQNRPDGFDCELLDDGANFSGGQQQRLEIARALATEPSILLLDEATSALDSPTEEQVLRNIRQRDCSCVIIAHRLSTIRNCDQILVMEDGAVVERGTHEELLALDGLYAHLINGAGE